MICEGFFEDNDFLLPDELAAESIEALKPIE